MYSCIVSKHNVIRASGGEQMKRHGISISALHAGDWITAFSRQINTHHIFPMLVGTKGTLNKETVETIFFLPASRRQPSIQQLTKSPTHFKIKYYCFFTKIHCTSCCSAYMSIDCSSRPSFWSIIKLQQRNSFLCIIPSIPNKGKCCKWSMLSLFLCTINFAFGICW